MARVTPKTVRLSTVQEFHLQPGHVALIAKALEKFERMAADDDLEAAAAAELAYEFKITAGALATNPNILIRYVAH